MGVPHARWLRELESESAKLKKLLAEARLNMRAHWSHKAKRPHEVGVCYQP